MGTSIQDDIREKSIDTAMPVAYSERMASNTRGSVKCKCGRTHRNGGRWITSTGIEHGCRYAAVIEAEEWRASAAGIKELAAQAREDGERHFGKAVRSDGTVSEYRLAEARTAYAKAYELEN